VPTNANHLQEAIAEFGAAKLARVLGVPKTTVESWKARRVPERWRPIVAVAIRHELERIANLLVEH
jgi:hypothetical protein